jgi:hypothetical protein
MPRKHPIIGVQSGADTDRNGLLTDAQMNRAAHLLLRVQLGYGLLHHANPEHLAQHRAPSIRL